MAFMSTLQAIPTFCFTALHNVILLGAGQAYRIVVREFLQILLEMIEHYKLHFRTNCLQKANVFWGWKLLKLYKRCLQTRISIQLIRSEP